MSIFSPFIQKLISRVIYAFTNKQLIIFQNFFGVLCYRKRRLHISNISAGNSRPWRGKHFPRELGVELVCLEYHCYFASSLKLTLKKISDALWVHIQWNHNIKIFLKVYSKFKMYVWTPQVETEMLGIANGFSVVPRHLHNKWSHIESRSFSIIYKWRPFWSALF